MNIKQFKRDMLKKELARKVDNLMDKVQIIGACYLVGAFIVLFIKNITL